MKPSTNSDARLQNLLLDLNFKDAETEADNLVKPFWDLSSHRYRSLDKIQLKILLMIAETRFYRGDRQSARELLAPLVFTKQGIEQVKKGETPHTTQIREKAIANFVNMTITIPVRWRLQLGELLYSFRLFDAAKTLANQLVGECRNMDKEFEQGEIEFFRLRIAHRQAMYNEMLDSAMLAMTAFATSSSSKIVSEDAKQKERPDRVRWRLGQLLLSFGSGVWKFGDPHRGIARLHLAEWMLAELPDKLSLANAKQAIGSMYRAQGQFPEKAKWYLEQALEAYEGLNHDLNVSRAWTSLGAYWISQKNPGEAQRCLSNAMTSAEKARSRRQRAEIFVWRSWIAQGEGNRQRALEEGEKALNLLDKRDEPFAIVEAYLAIGSAYLMKDNSLRMEDTFAQAERNLTEALKIAKEYKLRKQHINVLLTLGELRCRQLDFPRAWDYYAEATTKIFPDDKFPDSEYLRKKRDDLKKQLDRSNVFYLTFEEALEKEKILDDCRYNLDLWLINTMRKKEDGNTEKAAEELGISRQRLSRYLNDKHPTKNKEKKKKSKNKGKNKRSIDRNTRRPGKT